MSDIYVFEFQVCVNACPPLSYADLNYPWIMLYVLKFDFHNFSSLPLLIHQRAVCCFQKIEGFPAEIRQQVLMLQQMRAQGTR
jgi:hypothetical protein